MQAESIFLKYILAMPELIGEVRELLTNELLSVLVSKNIIRLLLEHYNEEKKEIRDLKKISGELSEAEREEFRDVFEQSKTIEKNRDQVEEEIESCILTFHDIYNKRKDKRITQEIGIAEREKNDEMAKKLALKKTEYRKLEYNKQIKIKI